MRYPHPSPRRRWTLGSSSRLATFGLFATLSTLAACSDDDPTPPAPTPSVALSVAPATLSVVQGQSGTVTATLARTNFTGPVAVTVEGVPAGVTATAAPASLDGSAGSSTITVAAGASTAPGPYTLTVRAAGAGITAQTATVALTVTAAPTPGNYTIALAPAAVSVVQGGTTTSTLNITRTGGFNGAVGIAVSGAPANLTVTPASTSTTGNSVALNVAAAASVAPGNYPITVTTSATGLANQATTLTVTVTAAPVAGGFTATLSPAAVSIAQGATTTSTLTIARTGGFTGAVGIAVSGTPQGLVVTPAAANTSDNSVALTVSATSTLATGTYPVTITTSAAGLTNQVATLTVTVTPAVAVGNYTLSVAPTTVTLAQGATSTATLNIARTGGFAGAVGVTVTGVPTGLTVLPASESTTGNSVTLNVSAAAALPPGTYPVTVRGTATGLTDQQTTLTVTVTAAVQQGFSLAVTPTTVTVQQGQTTTATVAITRAGGFTGPVDITVSGLPNGVTAEIVNALASSRSRARRRDLVTPFGRASAALVPITGNSATIRLTAAANAPTGAFTMTVTGTAQGLPTQTVNVNGSVTAAPSGGGVGFAFCEGAAPIWVGYQASEGSAWTRATVNANGSVSLPLTGPRSGVAYVYQGGTTFTVNVVYGSPAELTTFGTSACQVGAGGKTVNGSVVGLGPADQATISLGTAFAVALGGQSSFTLNNVAPGPRDLLATRSALSASGFTVNRGLLRRNVNVPDGGTLAPLDFGGAESFAPATANLTIANAGNDVAFTNVSYQTANGAGGTFFNNVASALLGTPSATQQYSGVPADRQVAGDFHILSAFAAPRSGQAFDATNARIAGVYFRAVSDRTVTLGAALNTPTVTAVASTPYVRPRVQLTRQAEYADAFAATFFQTGANSRTASITALASYAAGGNWDVTFPDLSGAAGFDPAWGLRPGAQINWTVIGSGGQNTAVIGGQPAEGSTFRAAFRSGNLSAALRSVFQGLRRR